MKITKKILSVFLSVLIMLSIFTVAIPVFAAEYDEYQETAQYTDSSSYGAQALSLDIFVPVIDSITGNPTSWTKGPVTLTVNATDYGSAGLAAKAYSFDGGNTWQASKSKTFNGNGTISIKVRDAAGNKSITKTVEITKIDTTAPTVSYKSGNPTSWTNKDVEIEVYGFDADSGIAAYYFNDVSYGLGTKKVCSQNQELKVKAKDHVGNYSNELSIYITKIDKSTPQVIAVSGNAAEWTNQDVTLNVDEYLCGDSGLEAYFFNGIKSMQSSKTFDSNKTVRVAVTNNAGTMSKSVDVVIDKIDKNNPTISGITVNENLQNPTQPSTVTVTASDNLSGVSQYSFDGGETWQEENTKEYFESCDNINIVVKDRAGNETSYSETISVNVTRPENYAPASPVIYSENNEVYILAGKTESSLVNSETAEFEYKVGENGTWKQCDGYLNIVNTYDVPVYARAVDKDGNYSEASSCIVKSNLGEYTASHNDIAYGEGVFPVPFERTYSSTNGWFFSFDANVKEITNGYVFTDFSGEKHHFILNEDGKYVSADGDELELNENDYVYKVSYGELECFFGTDGKLAFVKDNYISATYNWTANNLYIEDQAGNPTTVRISNGKPTSISIARHDDTTGENYTKYVSYQWDGDNLTKFTDAANIQHSYAYANGFLTQNETETIDYSAQGRVKRITQQNGAFVKYTYNDTVANSENAENIGAVTVSDSKGVTDTLYYADGFIITGSFDNYSDKAVYDPNNISNVLTEDVISNVAYAVKFDYDSDSDEETSGGENSGNNALSLYDKHSDGSYTFYKYDSNERVIESLEVAKGKLTVTADTTYADAEAVAKTKTTTTYVGDSDDISEWISFERNSDNVFVNSEKETYTYYENGEMNTLKSYKWSDTNWNVTLEEYYDQKGNIGIKDEYKYGEKVTVTRTKYTYDEEDKLTEQLVKVKDGTVEFVNSTLEKYVYNPQGDVTSYTVSQWLNDAWYLTYSEAYEFNAYGNNTKKTETVYTNDPKETGLVETTQTETVTDFVYDIWNQPTKTTVKEGDKEDVVTSVTYDIFGRTLSVTEDGKSTAYTYDNFDNVLTVTDEDGTTTYEYTNGNLVKRTNPNNTVANYTYDGFGNLTSHSYNGYSFTYNTLGSILTASAENEQLVSYTYSADVSQNVLDSAFGNGQSVSYTYDDEGRITATKFGEETKYGYTYFDEKDENGKVTKEWTELTDYVNNLKKVFEENKTTVKDLNGNVVYSVEYFEKNEDDSESFDGRIEKCLNVYYKSSYEEDKDSYDSTFSGFSAKMKYNDNGNLSKILYDFAPDKAFVDKQYEYEKDNSIKSISHEVIGFRNDRSTDKNFSYTYDKSGNIKSETSKTIERNTDGIQVEYSDTVTYSYDGKNQLAKAENNTTKWEYSYDNRGNILSKQEYTVTIDEPGEKVYTESKNNTYSYDDQWKDKLISFNGQTIVYDTTGNPTNYIGHDLTWSMGRQLTSFDDITYTYNEDGLRASKTVNGVTTKYYYDGTRLVDLVVGLDNLHFNYNRNGEVIGFTHYNVGDRESSPTMSEYIYIKNLQGDVVALASTAGIVKATYTYDPWGRLLNIEKNPDPYDYNIAELNPIRYRGYVYDNETNLYYLQSRYYDPEVGRFINCDDVNYIGASKSELSYNAFAYCENEPVNHEDLNGTVSINTICISFVNIIKKLFLKNNDLGQRIKDRYKTSKFGKSPLTIKISGNKMNISVKFRFIGSLKDVRFQNKPHNKTYKQIFLDAVEQYWSGSFYVYGYNVTLSTTAKADSSSGINVHMLDSYGVSCRIGPNGWSRSTGDYGYITMYRGDSRSESPSNYDFNGFRFVSAHEFGHILGVDDVYKDKKYTYVKSIFNVFGTRVQNCDVEMVLMAFMLNRCIAYYDYIVNRERVI